MDKPTQSNLIPDQNLETNKLKNKGQVLAIALVITAVLMLLSTGILAFTSSEYLYSSSSYKKVAAVNLAEAGVENAIKELSNDPNYSGTGGSTIALDNGEFEVSVTADSEKRYITATGYVPAKANYKAIKIVNLTVSQTSTGQIQFPYAVQADSGGITMGNNSSIAYKAYSNANISGGNNSRINGDAYAVGTIGSNPTVTGEKKQNQPPSTIPTMNFDYWRNLAAAGGTQEGNYNISGTMSLGPKKIHGNLTMSNNCNLTITGPVYVTGNFSTSNNCVINAGSGLGSNGTVVIADGRVIFSNNTVVNPNNSDPKGYIMFATPSTATNAVTISNNCTVGPIYAPNGRANISNNASNTCIIAKTLNLSNNATITYSTDFLNLHYDSGTPGGAFSVVPGTWIEK